MLNGDGPYTLFAPSNDAFARIPPHQVDALMADPEALKQIVSAHIVPGHLSTTDLLQGRSGANLAGQKVPVGIEGNLKVGEAKVTQTINAKNGIVHVIDRVML